MFQIKSILFTLSEGLGGPPARCCVAAQCERVRRRGRVRKDVHERRGARDREWRRRPRRAGAGQRRERKNRRGRDANATHALAASPPVAHARAVAASDVLRKGPPALRARAPPPRQQRAPRRRQTQSPRSSPPPPCARRSARSRRGTGASRQLRRQRPARPRHASLAHGAAHAQRARAPQTPPTARRRWRRASPHDPCARAAIRYGYSTAPVLARGPSRPLPCSNAHGTAGGVNRDISLPARTSARVTAPRCGFGPAAGATRPSARAVRPPRTEESRAAVLRHRRDRAPPRQRCDPVQVIGVPCSHATSS